MIVLAGICGVVAAAAGRAGGGGRPGRGGHDLLELSPARHGGDDDERRKRPVLAAATPITTPGFSREEVLRLGRELRDRAQIQRSIGCGVSRAGGRRRPGVEAIEARRTSLLRCDEHLVVVRGRRSLAGASQARSPSCA